MGEAHTQLIQNNMPWTIYAMHNFSGRRWKLFKLAVGCNAGAPSPQSVHTDVRTLWCNVQNAYSFVHVEACERNSHSAQKNVCLLTNDNNYILKQNNISGNECQMLLSSFRYYYYYTLGNCKKWYRVIPYSFRLFCRLFRSQKKAKVFSLVCCLWYDLFFVDSMEIISERIERLRYRYSSVGKTGTTEWNHIYQYCIYGMERWYAKSESRKYFVAFNVHITIWRSDMILLISECLSSRSHIECIRVVNCAATKHMHIAQVGHMDPTHCNIRGLWHRCTRHVY